MVSEDYVSFDTAKLLKEKGFEQLTYACFTTDGDDLYDYRAVDNDIMRPTLQMTMKWLREMHNIFINISFRFSRNADNDINFSYYAEKYENHYGYGDGEFNSYEEACEAAIKYCLENLI